MILDKIWYLGVEVGKFVKLKLASTFVIRTCHSNMFLAVPVKEGLWCVQKASRCGMDTSYHFKLLIGLDKFVVWVKHLFNPLYKNVTIVYTRSQNLDEHSSELINGKGVSF